MIGERKKYPNNPPAAPAASTVGPCNICFHPEVRKIIFEISLMPPLIWSSVKYIFNCEIYYALVLIKFLFLFSESKMDRKDKLFVVNEVNYFFTDPDLMII